MIRAMRLDLQDLRLFQAVARERNITRAAGAMHLSLAAASARIKAIESQAGVPLLYRQARGVRLTPAGEAFLHHAHAILLQAGRMGSDLHAYAQGLRGHVRVHANTTGITEILPEVLPAYLKAWPQVDVELQESPNAGVARSVREGRADLGIVAGEVQAAGLRCIHFSTDRLVLLVPRGHRFARLRRIAFADTLDEDHVGLHPTSTLHDFLARASADFGKPLRLRVELSSFDAICRMVDAGIGVAVIPQTSARRSLGSLAIAQVELTDAWRTRERSILLREGEPPAQVQALVDALVRHGQAGAGGPDAPDRLSAATGAAARAPRPGRKAAGRSAARR